MAVTRIDQLADDERARFNEWADRWIDIGLRTGPADRERFEAAVADCYRFAGIPFPEHVVWVPSPLVLAFAAPAAAYTIELIASAERRKTLGGNAVGGAVRGAVGNAVDGAVGGAVRNAVDGAVGNAVGGAVRGAVGNAVGRGALDAVARGWPYIMGGQFWVGYWYYGSPAMASFFREVCKLDLPGDTWDRSRAHEQTAESACWWWPHRRFVMVCERPAEIHRELVNPERPRGWESHRLHRDDGPAIVWPDGWGVYSVHGVRVPRHVIEDPNSLSVTEISGEENAEIRRVMMERYGLDRYLRESKAVLVDQVHEPPYRGLLDAKLWRLEVPGDEPLVIVECLNSSAEPDGSRKTYWLRVDPDCRPLLRSGGFGGPQDLTVRNALASTWGMRGEEYVPLVET